jgi:hypothetical protein
MCPYSGSECSKRSTVDKRHPYPVCTLLKANGASICVCPKRFYEVDFLQDVIDYVWPDPKPRNPRIASEVTMAGFGKVDFVVADVNAAGTVSDFVSVELQAIDITGSVREAYDALIASQVLEKRPTYGFNWMNVYKRYIHQLIAKGYYHHHWKTKIVAAIQDEVYAYIRNSASFMVNSDLSDPMINIVFLIYGYSTALGENGLPKMELKEVAGTSHSALQQAILYKTALPKSEFKSKIEQRLGAR